MGGFFDKKLVPLYEEKYLVTNSGVFFLESRSSRMDPMRYLRTVVRSSVSLAATTRRRSASRCASLISFSFILGGSSSSAS